MEASPLPSPLSAADREPEFAAVAPSSKRLRERDWINRYVNEWGDLAQGRFDVEITTMDGMALQHVVGHRPPEEVARQHYNACTGADSAAARAEEKFQELAVMFGLTKSGQPLPKAALEFAYGVATLCAGAVDRFRDPREGSAGDHIRGLYGPVPF
ncbi:hypothetical protein QMO14_16770 [Variovorax sp. CAN2819]|uniref:hypothetical protein n=1 Tax=Variovorax sp. CAN15 TaxID=3046727 RepID=UPI002648A9C6|nr:hypothetical protein [Variovorax sp. CAN15]MDN6885260.1 hypothetical protein [Variovorax sp. CAN15]